MVHIYARNEGSEKSAHCTVESGSFRPWVVSAGSIRPGSFRPNFGVSRFGLFWWVVSAVSRFGHGLFRPSVCVRGWGGGGGWGVLSFFLHT